MTIYTVAIQPGHQNPFARKAHIYKKVNLNHNRMFLVPAYLLLVPHIIRVALGLLAHILGELALVVASRIIFAHNIEPIGLALTAVALLPTAPNGLGVLPHNLGEVAGVPRETGLVPVVLLSLGSPHVDERAPAGKASAAGEVLTSTLFVFC